MLKTGRKLINLLQAIFEAVLEFVRWGKQEEFSPRRDRGLYFGSVSKRIPKIAAGGENGPDAARPDRRRAPARRAFEIVNTRTI